ncbi:hypothetical protein BKA62DRAFT_701689 [Auriculariales sp. MPI-PUGE-AT-0066]|nr:hypothetical protein BKA62DRAFT_701689 [Auriculariales sp. MPI-PUGE-AT-0066]
MDTAARISMLARSRSNLAASSSPTRFSSRSTSTSSRVRARRVDSRVASMPCSRSRTALSDKRCRTRSTSSWKAAPTVSSTAWRRTCCSPLAQGPHAIFHISWRPPGCSACQFLQLGELRLHALDAAEVAWDNSVTVVHTAIAVAIVRYLNSGSGIELHHLCGPGVCILRNRAVDVFARLGVRGVTMAANSPTRSIVGYGKTRFR